MQLDVPAISAAWFSNVAGIERSVAQNSDIVPAYASISPGATMHSSVRPSASAASVVNRPTGAVGWPDFSGSADFSARSASPTRS
jgi:hypothetical protein